MHQTKILSQKPNQDEQTTSHHWFNLWFLSWLIIFILLRMECLLSPCCNFLFQETKEDYLQASYTFTITTSFSTSIIGVLWGCGTHRWGWWDFLSAQEKGANGEAREVSKASNASTGTPKSKMVGSLRLRQSCSKIQAKMSRKGQEAHGVVCLGFRSLGFCVVLSFDV